MKLGLIGHPVAHSRSPALHAAAGTACGIQVEYQLYDTPRGQVAERFAGLRAAGLRGFNVTAPHKARAFELCAGRSPAAEAVAAVNTVVFEADGAFGDNTDVEGFRRALGQPPGERAMVLGAGGAARAVLFALSNLGIEARVFNRSVERARERLGEDHTVSPLEAVPGHLAETDLLVNCLSRGAAAWVAGLRFEALPAHALVFDLNYGAAAAPVLEAVRRAERRAMGGLEMLAWQGIAAFERWTGAQPPLAAVLAALDD